MSRSDRIARIVLLLDALDYDYLPSARTLQLASKPGPAESGRVPCECAALKVVLYRDARCCPPGCDRRHEHTRHVQRYELVGNPKCRQCEDGWIRCDPRQGPDRYTHGQDEAVRARKHRALGTQPRQTMTERELGQALDRLAAQWPTLRDADQKVRFAEAESFGWERERAKRDASGDFPALIRALDELRMWREAAYRALMRDGDPYQLGEALFFLELVMPEPVRVPLQLLESAGYRRRMVTVQELHEFGRTPRQISRALRIDLRKVKVILSQQRLCA